MTGKGQRLLVRADDKFKVILGSYPAYIPRSGLVFTVEGGTEANVSAVVKIIWKEVRTILGRATVILGKNVVEYIGLTSLNAEQMMGTITLALSQEAGIFREQTKSVSRFKIFMARLGNRYEPAQLRLAF